MKTYIGFRNDNGKRFWLLAAAVVAALLFNPMLGSLCCRWSVFLDPLEAELGLPRAKISGIFSIAIFCFTVGMIFAPFATNECRRHSYRWSRPFFA